MRDLFRKIISANQLATKIKSLNKGGLKVVFTNGCFDLLHEGHVAYLQRARNLGDVLVVALDTDAAVRAQKGSGRPINPLRSRQRVIAALESVDFVTSFGGSNPLPLINKLRPHVLAKGGDWKIQQIIGAKETLERGGKVYSLPFVKGKSTTNIVKQIRLNGSGK
jgi:rfaE bifunctional protein nucleotidyltransferase chain/domain